MQTLILPCLFRPESGSLHIYPSTVGHCHLVQEAEHTPDGPKEGTVTQARQLIPPGKIESVQNEINNDYQVLNTSHRLGNVLCTYTRRHLSTIWAKDHYSLSSIGGTGKRSSWEIFYTSSDKGKIGSWLQGPFFLYSVWLCSAHFPWFLMRVSFY